MILSVPVGDNGQVGGHFGRAHVMAVARVEEGELVEWHEHVVEWDVLHDQAASHGQHHARIVRFLTEHQIERVLFSGMGQGMVNTITKMGLALIQVGEPMKAKDAVVAAAGLEVGDNVDMSTDEPR